MTTMAVEEKLDIGKVLSSTVTVLRRNLVTFALLSLLLVGVPSLIATIGVVQMFSSDGGIEIGPAAFAPMFFGGLISIITTAILQGAVIYGTIRDLNSHPATFAECLATGLRNFLPLIGLSLLMTLGIACGLILFVVPGIILALMWAVAVPAKVAEGIGVFDAFGRSRQLTRNNRLMILVLLIIYVVISMVIGMLMSAVGLGANPVTGTNVVGQAIGETITNIVAAPILATAASVVYVELRRLKEGVESSALAAFFD